MKHRLSLALTALMALAAVSSLSTVTGCKDIPVFNVGARPVNRDNSALELETEINNTLASLRVDGILTQADIDRNFTPRINKAEKIIKDLRAYDRAVTTQPATTAPSGTLEEAKNLLTSVRDELVAIRRSH